MKKVSELVANEKVDIYLLISDVQKGTASNGSPYLTLILQDATGVIEGKLWDATEEDEKKFVKGIVVKITGDVLKYRENLQIKINSIEEIKTVDKAIFLPTAPVDQQSLQEEIYSYILRIKNINIQRITRRLVDKYKDKFFSHPAAIRIHHEYMSGLAYHVKCMLNLAEKVCEVYPDLNSDLLYAGVILHDIGKVIELKQSPANEYTKEGKLIGHVAISYSEIIKIASELKIEDTEEVLVLSHMILAQHGKLEYGSPIIPMIKEAEILSLIDLIDSRVAIMRKAIKDVEKGEFTDKIFGMDGRNLYNHKIE